MPYTVYEIWNKGVKSALSIKILHRRELWFPFSQWNTPTLKTKAKDISKFIVDALKTRDVTNLNYSRVYNDAINLDRAFQILLSKSESLHLDDEEELSIKKAIKSSNYAN